MLCYNIDGIQGSTVMPKFPGSQLSDL